MKKKLALAMTMCLALTACGNQASSGDTPADGSQETIETPAPTAEPAPTTIPANYDGIEKVGNGAKISVHDPSIFGENGKYYIVGSHMTAGYSEDLQTWKNLANGYNPGNPVYGELFEEGLHVFDYAGSKNSVIPTDDGGYHVWAPQVIYNETMQKYVMYYCTSSTWNASNLCYGISDTIEGPYVWQAPLIYSGFTEKNVSATDVLDYVTEDYVIENYIKGGGYNYEDYPNAIDPAAFYDENGNMWMVYGSWSGGIFILEIDEETGDVIHPEADPENNVDPYFGKKLLGGDHKSIEGPHIQYDPSTGYYYLYLCYGGLAENGGYQIRVWRSENPDGPYEDMAGNTEIKGNHAYYGLKLSGNYYLPSAYYSYKATGGMSTMIDTDGKSYVCYHTRFNTGTEYHEPCVKQIFMNEEGWPTLAPYTTSGETLSQTGYDMADMAGEYYFINQGMEIDDKVAEPVMIYLNEDGTVSGSIRGTWTVTEGTPYVHITYNNKEYSGVFCKMMDETGKVETMTFSCVGKNESIWGVKY
ncbi:MAG: glycoside hydrolase family 43 protein [Lachnospiraceae bacterium]|nr:glycoside hydrolase family 43 protein [Lachnospiraceae bacterium]